MGFLGSKKGSKSVASKSIASNSNDGITTKSTDSANNKKNLLKKGQKLLQKVVSSKASTSTIAKSTTAATYPETPSNGVAAATKTPATTLLQNENEPSTLVNRYHSNYLHNQNQTTTPAARAIVSSKAVEYGTDQDQDYDVTSKEVLEERERIREELFGDDNGEEGIEVTAQFRQPYGQQQQQQHDQGVPTAITASARQHLSGEEEKKEDDSPSSPPGKSYKNSNHNSLPPTPELDPCEADPVARFPAVQAAMAARKAVVVPPSPDAQPKTTTTGIDTSPSFPLLSTTAAAAVATTTTTNTKNRMAQTTARTTTAQPVSPSPEKPFDEDPTHPKDPSAEHETGAYSPSPEKPFDEDPIRVVEPHNEPKQEDFFQLAAAAAAGCTSGANVNDDGKPLNVTRKLLDVFNCGNDNDFTEFSGSSEYTKTAHHSRSCRLVDAFYDNTCYWTYREATQMNRPYYDEQFAQRFLRDITNEGVNILWHLPPADDEESVVEEHTDWSGCSVVMKIKAGSCYADNDAQPKLTWTTLGGGKNNKSDKAARCSVPLLAIQSISTFKETICEGDEVKEPEVTNTSYGMNLTQLEDDEDVCLFAITTEEGDVQVFEAASVEQRDLLVTGLKNVIARLSFHLVLGDVGASSELYYEEEKSPPPGELPSFSSPIQNMNRIAHALLD